MLASAVRFARQSASFSTSDSYKVGVRFLSHYGNMTMELVYAYRLALAHHMSHVARTSGTCVKSLKNTLCFLPEIHATTAYHTLGFRVRAQGVGLRG